MGFGVKVGDRPREFTDMLSFVESDDLLKYGFIPEFIGRFPVITTLNGLAEGDLVRILTEPKNAIIKQYQRFFELENVKLEFTEDSLKIIARRAIQKGTGARALRSILESIMLDVMYEIPSQKDIAICRINEAVVNGHAQPELIKRSDSMSKSA